MNPLITISIPIYNVEKYVERSLSSALNQTYDNLEILVIDDKGTDNSMEVVRRIIDTHPRGKAVKIIEHSENKGLGATRNTSIDNAQGEYIMFMDSDDYISDDCISKLYKSSYDNCSDIVIGSYQDFSMTGDIGKGFIQNLGAATGYDVLWQWYKSPMVYVQTWNKLYKTNLLRDNFVRCIPSNRNEDVFFTFQLLKPVKSVSFVSDITYYYQTMNPEAITYNMCTGVFDYKEHMQYLEILDNMIAYMSKHNLNKDNFLNDYFQWFYRIRVGRIMKATSLALSKKEEYLKDLRSLPLDTIAFPNILEGIRKYGKSWIWISLPPKIAVSLQPLYLRIKKVFKA